jgi:hypothetical protein
VTQLFADKRVTALTHPTEHEKRCSILSLSFGTPFAPSNLVRRIGAVRRDVVLRFGNIQRIMPAWN